MSAEMTRLIINLNQKELENQLALQCAPLLMGIKISNILIVDEKDADRVKESAVKMVASGAGISGILKGQLQAV